MMQIVEYTDSDKILWDNYIKKSKNGTFLLQRDYMDYHYHRFKDMSLVIKDGKGNIISLLPANILEDTLYSHLGLTYGGFITDNSMTTPRMMEIFNEVLMFLKAKEIQRLVYKTIPFIYHLLPAEEDRYALFRNNARLYRRDVLSVISLKTLLPYQQRRRRAINKAMKYNLQVRELNDFTAFWQVLEENLHIRYQVKPVHSLEEIQLLHALFPENIKLHVCYENDKLIAGVVIYKSTNVAHVQYISANERGKAISALDLLFSILIENVYAQCEYFDFGISNENDGHFLNEGLIQQKEGFGARAVVHDFYEILLK